MDEYKNIRNRWKEYCIKRGLTEGEATYVINRLTNNIRKYDNVTGINFSIDEDREIEYWQDSFELYSGKKIIIGFYGD